MLVGLLARANADRPDQFVITSEGLDNAVDVRLAINTSHPLVLAI